MQEIAPNIIIEKRFAPYNLGVVVTEHGVIAIDVPPPTEPGAALAGRDSQLVGATAVPDA